MVATSENLWIKKYYFTQTESYFTAFVSVTETTIKIKKNPIFKE